jgi:hypothetical protein
MTNSDRHLAGLLGEAPPAHDPNFRARVLLKIAHRAQRKAARLRALKTMALFALIGAAFPALSAMGLNAAIVEPLLLTALMVGVAYAAAQFVIKGPTRTFAQLRAAIR